MRGKHHILLLILVAPMLTSPSLCAQTASPRAPVEFVGGYDLALGAWSRPLGINAVYHAIPATVRLDTAAATREVWRRTSPTLSLRMSCGATARVTCAPEENPYVNSTT